MFSFRHKKIWVAGETGLVGRALTRALSAYDLQILSAPHSALELTDQRATFDWLSDNKPDCVIVAAAKVGGIGANTQSPADFICENLAIAGNVIEGAHRAGVQHLLFLGSSCIYPREAPQPISENSLMTGPLEPTNEAYAIAKIAGLKLCQFYTRQHGRNYISAMPTNLYGPFDRFHAERGHVIPAMMMKFHEAKISGAREVVLWGTGAPLREFLHVDDLARALLVQMENYTGEEPLNVGSGEEIAIYDLAQIMKRVTGYQGEIVFDSSKPDGMPRKFLNSSKIRALGWSPTIDLVEGLGQAYAWYCENAAPRLQMIA